jgi:hypothetical protein
VSIAGQNVLVDGAPYLALGFFDVGYNDLAAVAATGANTINGFYLLNSTDCFNTGQESYLDKAYDLGLNFLPDSTYTARLQNPSIFPAVAQTFAPHLANIGWFLADEPDLIEIPPLYVPPAMLVAESTALKTKTSLPVIADFEHAFWGPVSQIAPYNGSADIWMSEPYGDTDFIGINNAVNLFNAIQSRPIWLAQNLLDDTTIIVPKAYWAIIAGSTGILYYVWANFQASPSGLAAAQQAFSELKGLQNAIFGDKMDSLVIPPGGNIATMSRFDPGTGTAYILSANSSTQTVPANFAVQGLAAGQQISVLYENRTITAGAGTFSDTFAGVSRHVYSIQSAATSLTASMISTTGLTASRDWKFQVYDTGIGAANHAAITGLTLTQTAGATCTPVVAPGTFPVALGNILPAASATGDVIINFTGCGSTAKFNMNLTVAANGGATTATIVRNNVRM